MIIHMPVVKHSYRPSPKARHCTCTYHLWSTYPKTSQLGRFNIIWGVQEPVGYVGYIYMQLYTHGGFSPNAAAHDVRLKLCQLSSCGFVGPK